MDAVLEQLLASPLVYLLIAGSIAGSAVFPPLPSESMLITAMGLAAAALWTAYGALVAYAGNALFPEALWLSLTAAVVTALGVGAVAHRLGSRRR